MYYLVYGFLYLLSLLPMRALYVLSDFFFILTYYVFGYRKKVILGNLALAFPEKTATERQTIARQFYRNLIDSFIETIKMVSASQSFLKKRVSANWEVLEPLYKTGKSVQIHLGHTFNWEWGQHVLQAHTAYKILVVYMPLTSKLFERIMYKMRTSTGNVFIGAGEMATEMEQYKNQQYLLGLVADQSPGSLHAAYWTNFFNIPTAFVSGPEKGARAKNIPVLFTAITKPRRGYYKAALHVETENPLELEEGELTLRYAAFMEKIIRQNPEMWLWSHRRWKHSWNEQYAHNWVGSEPPKSKS